MPKMMSAKPDPTATIPSTGRWPGKTRQGHELSPWWPTDVHIDICSPLLAVGEKNPWKNDFLELGLAMLLLQSVSHDAYTRLTALSVLNERPVMTPLAVRNQRSSRSSNKSIFRQLQKGLLIVIFKKQKLFWAELHCSKTKTRWLTSAGCIRTGGVGTHLDRLSENLQSQERGASVWSPRLIKDDLSVQLVVFSYHTLVILK